MIVFSSRVSEEAPAINFETWGTKGLPRKYSFFSRFLFPSLGRSLSLSLSLSLTFSFSFVFSHTFSLSFSLSLSSPLGHTLSPSRRPPCSLHLLPSLDLPPRGARWLTSGTKTKIPAYPGEGEEGEEEGSKRRNLLSLRLCFSFPAVARASIKPRFFLPSGVLVPPVSLAFVLSLLYLDFSRSFYPSRFTSAFSRSRHCATARSRREGCPHIESHINIPVKVPRVV